eukprot:TRINITY_DN22370_c0_g1_i1.p1 TRINITY_DN22370_c0_g1~~TRINITY_DN22370_c0_g1_i1.p1  ORF type:complete len:172 (-),score=43.28 TRINITY_DN22370_c0_g1_i1:82-597(-)
MILRCCLWCLEKCVRWLNKQVYIQTVITGCWFCPGICKVCRALLNNLGYILMCGYVSTAMLWFGKLSIAVGTAAIGVLCLERRELTSVVFPGFLMMMIGFGVALMFCEVYELVIDTMLMCFCEAKMNSSGCICLLYTSDAADDLLCVDLGGRRIIKKKNIIHMKDSPHSKD